MSRKDASALRRQLILATALRCFAKQGIQATTVDDIHRAAGVSIGSIYHHFASKDLLVQTVYVEGLHSSQVALLAELAHYDTAQAGIEGLVRCALSRLLSPTLWSRASVPAHAYALNPAAAQHVAALEQTFAADLAIWLDPHIQAGTLLSLPPACYLAILFGPGQAFAAAWLGGRHEPPLAEAHAVLGAAAWAALRRPAAA